MSKSAVYAPSPEFVRNANVQGMEGYRALYERAKQDPQAFWGDIAEKELDWFQKWDTVLDWSNPPFAKWFSGAKINVS
jgi:acetyl-CoA synthetase